MIKKILLVLVALVIIAGVVLYFTLDNIVSKSVKYAINTYGPQATQTSVTVKDVGISVFGGSAKIGDLQVGNPESFQPPANAFSLGDISVSLQPASLMSDIIVIDEITITDAEFNYITKTFTSSNLQTILDNVKDFSGKAAQAPATTTPATAEQPPAAASQKKFVIHNVRVTGAKANATVLGQSIKVEIPDIILQNESPEGINPAELVDKVLSDVLVQVIEQISKQVEEIAKDPTKAGLDIIKGATDTGDETVDKAVDTIKNLF
ncbi:hypothetical protein H5P28_01900 [Ruficoccus amylovorans]|uniref:AsmA family protein n=1 Tax=Ruficoccus amylovorans TaxID=1804625 RepID=A0A842HBR2_9BACT|nr:AsmA family protein [Ruficoccus amylovorans]MBC2593004.1 hypothetical protein [Ruficoccus amylovorans]